MYSKIYDIIKSSKYYIEVILLVYIVSSILIITLICINLKFSIDDWSKIITTTVAIGGLMIACSYNNGTKNQKEQLLLQNKREYYNKFIEAYTKHLYYSSTNNKKILNSKEYVIALENFCLECSRLKLYASKEVILLTDCIYLLEQIDANISRENRHNSPVYNYDILKKDFCNNFNNSILLDLNEIKSKLLSSNETITILEKNDEYIQSVQDLKSKSFDINNEKELYFKYYCAIINILCSNILITFIRKDLNMEDYVILEKGLYGPNLLVIENEIHNVDKYLDKDLEKMK